MLISDKLPRKKLCVDLIGPITRIKDRNKCNVQLKTFSINPPYHKIYIMHNKAMTIANLVDIYFTTKYNHS